MSGNGRLITTSYYGGKNQPQIQDRLLDLLDYRTSYLEPFCGSAGVLLNRRPVKCEMLNDIDDLIVNFFKILRDRPKDLISALELTPYARTEHAKCSEMLRNSADLDDVERARCWYVATSMSLAGEVCGRFSTSSPKSKKYPPHYNRVKETLALVADRLLRVTIENRDAVDLIRNVRTEDCTIYCDPPYMRESRTYDGGYAKDGNDNLHSRLLDAVVDCPAQVVMSIYDTPLYRERLKKWHRIEVPVAKRAAAPKRGSEEKELPRAVETIYVNQLPQGFSEFLDGIA